MADVGFRRGTGAHVEMNEAVNKELKPGLYKATIVSCIDSEFEGKNGIAACDSERVTFEIKHDGDVYRLAEKFLFTQSMIWKTGMLLKAIGLMGANDKMVPIDDLCDEKVVGSVCKVEVAEREYDGRDGTKRKTANIVKWYPLTATSETQDVQSSVDPSGVLGEPVPDADIPF